jgi:hypothetical protein
MGIAVMRRADYDFAAMEHYFSRFPSKIRDVNRHEQTLYALLLSVHGAHRLSSTYQLSRQPISDSTISHHFVNDGSRIQFSTRGIRALRRRGMTDAISGAGLSEGTSSEGRR